MKPVCVLIHSPLVGPTMWEPVRMALRRRAVQTSVPELMDNPASGVPFWQQHTESVAHFLSGMPAEQPVVLVGHSGAGPLLPSIGLAAQRPVAAYVFVDAGIARDGLSRLELMRQEDPAFAAQFRQFLEAGGRFPEWTEEQLRDLVPAAGDRQALLAQLRSRGLPFFNEPIPVPAGWPDARCGYLQFSAAYDYPARQARELGWPYRRIDAGHFHMLVDPDAVAVAIIELAGEDDAVMSGVGER